MDAYRQFLTEIGYPREPDDFTHHHVRCRRWITTTAGPQLVVPVPNARFALNAANARRGSLYDALYGTDVIPRPPKRPHVQQGSATSVAYARMPSTTVFRCRRVPLATPPVSQR